VQLFSVKVGSVYSCHARCYLVFIGSAWIFTGLSPTAFCDVEFLLPDGLEEEGGPGVTLGLGRSPLGMGSGGASEYTPTPTFSGQAAASCSWAGNRSTVVLPNTSAVGWSGSTADELGAYPVGWGLLLQW